MDDLRHGEGMDSRGLFLLADEADVDVSKARVVAGR